MVFDEELERRVRCAVAVTGIAAGRRRGCLLRRLVFVLAALHELADEVTQGRHHWLLGIGLEGVRSAGHVTVSVCFSTTEWEL